MKIYLELDANNKILCYGFSNDFEIAGSSTLVEIERNDDDGVDVDSYYINNKILKKLYFILYMSGEIAGLHHKESDLNFIREQLTTSGVEHELIDFKIDKEQEEFLLKSVPNKTHFIKKLTEEQKSEITIEESKYLIEGTNYLIKLEDKQ